MLFEYFKKVRKDAAVLTLKGKVDAEFEKTKKAIKSFMSSGVTEDDLKELSLYTVDKTSEFLKDPEVKTFCFTLVKGIVRAIADERMVPLTEEVISDYGTFAEESFKLGVKMDEEEGIGESLIGNFNDIAKSKKLKETVENLKTTASSISASAKVKQQ